MKKIILPGLLVFSCLMSYAQTWWYPSAGLTNFGGTVDIVSAGNPTLKLSRNGYGVNSAVIGFYNSTGSAGFLGVKTDNVIALAPTGDLVSGGNNIVEFNTSTKATSFSGNVFMGPFTTTTKSPTGYVLNVDGKVRANEVVVNATGADFVFEENYELIPLTDLEIYINKNKHLPGVPSASAMQENGMSVSETTSTLLQKIEELTLYVIALQKETENLREEVATLKQK